MALSWEAIKDPDDVKDYSLSWADVLGPDSDTIATSGWTLVSGSGLVIDSDTNGDDFTTVWLSSGTDNTVYLLRNRITTAGGRQYDQTMKLRVKTK